ncbi:uncharacterized protein V1477_005742 [Vespula maculifrons]|uniref:Uncharacterized protein n=1 Tax=Vespula maculifrons TaxID=7453 RepID=A0ABD2CLW3_VESMC
MKKYFPYCQNKTGVLRTHAHSMPAIRPYADRRAPEHTYMERDNGERFKRRYLTINMGEQRIVGFEEKQEVPMEKHFISDVKCLMITLSLGQIHISSLDVIRMQISFNSDPLQYFPAIRIAFAFV